MLSEEDHTTWLEIDLGAIADNLRKLTAISGARVMAVVKANAYGHGLIRVAQTAVGAGAAWCGVARLEEALALRSAGIESPILVMGDTPAPRMGEAAEKDISITLFRPEQLPSLGTASKRTGKTLRVHVKVDTGMGRLGVPVDKALGLLRDLQSSAGVIVEGLFTHFALADEPDRPETGAQLTLFSELLSEAEMQGLRPPLAHAANSAAALTRMEARFDLVRTGISLYGMNPSASVELPEGFRPALSWRAQLSSVRRFPPGRGISYGHEYTTRKDERIGVVPVGYGDGYRRTGGNSVLVGGVEVPVVGRVCMDQFMVNLDSVPQAQPGDEVVLLGSQGAARITAEDIALRWRTISYEVTSGLSSRIPRLYVGL